jgi:5-methylcytosine-specific restriction protein B
VGDEIKIAGDEDKLKEETAEAANRQSDPRQSQIYVDKKLGIQIGLNGPKRRCNANDYLTVLDTIEARFQEEAYPVHSFPELSLAAWLYKDDGLTPPTDQPDEGGQEGDEDLESESIVTIAPIEPYSIDDILDDGCFIEQGQLENLLERLRTKKNIILQGPPGTGKTWLAKRLAFALVGQKNDNGKIRAVQFHPNLSYEDFVRGWRPSGDGKLSLVDGPFLEMVKAASKEPTVRYVVVIEEINRGNPAQIFGEMLTLLEADKRTPSEALELCYRRSDGERVFIPDKLYVIGTMNIADRSIALVDLAL